MNMSNVAKLTFSIFKATDTAVFKGGDDYA
jgi:hypothetical protein